MDGNETAINWHELPGNKWMKSLEPAMLTIDGLQIRQVIKPIGRPGLSPTQPVKKKKWYVVSYDRTYVINYLIYRVMNALNIPSFDYLLDLMIEVWEAYHCNENEKLQETVSVKQLLEEYRKRDVTVSEEF